MDPTAEGYGGEYKFVTLKHDYTSNQTAQVWQDEPSVCIQFCLIITSLAITKILI